MSNLAESEVAVWLLVGYRVTGWCLNVGRWVERQVADPIAPMCGRKDESFNLLTVLAPSLTFPLQIFGIHNRRFRVVQESLKKNKKYKKNRTK